MPQMHHGQLTIHSRSAFTLIELLVVIAIIAILSVVVILTLNPAELLRQSRDANRVSDMATINGALGIYAEDTGGSMGSSNVVYVSIPDPSATSTSGDQCQGLGLPSLPGLYSYHCAASSTYRNVDGTGWIPVNFQSISSGPPVGSLPIDPFNISSSRFYYTYTTDGTLYEVTAVMESSKYKPGGSNDVISGDGGPLASVYEKGSKLGLEPLDYGDPSLVGLWTFDEGSGTVAYNYSGNNTTGSWSGTRAGNNGTYYTNGKVGNYAGYFDGTDDWLNLGSVPHQTVPLTLTFWVNPATSTPVGIFDSAPGQADVIRNFPEGSCAAGSSGGAVFEWWVSNPTICFSLPANTWSFVALTYAYDGNRRMSYYLNGQLKVSATGNTNLSLAWTALHVGAVLSSGVTSWYQGSLDDFRIYNRALSAAEIQAMYNGQK
jgi:prepilin-type N-terminal cleavage/methylation domain-containing protein